MSKTVRSSQRAYAILERMKGGRNANGFTIIETIMTLAISAGLFVIIAATMAGRQNRTEFSQGIQEVKSQIEQVINDMGSGLYPNTNNFRCSNGAFGPNITAGTGDQGGNTGCVFLGRAMQFKVAGTSNPEQFRTFTIAGSQKNTTGQEVQDYVQANPTAVAPSTANTNVPDATTAGKLQYGLTIKSMRYGNTNIGAFAVVNSLPQYNGASLASGSQQLNIVPINGSALNRSPQQIAQAINQNLETSPVNPSSGITMCFDSGGSRQSGEITIGGGGRPLSVTLQIKETPCS